ncbi:hypothetical protein CHS0354_004080 [Potamilus streckersoni]|uniref:Uncharacterized protein n=1 Tax=Potamilus streckersoni TaxID=2493646 RepID=A0AAE0T8T1_9BIVA|nr:hypothetical protein CHS0354_004080 [Potamilus streckersoni]
MRHHHLLSASVQAWKTPKNQQLCVGKYIRSDQFAGQSQLDEAFPLMIIKTQWNNYLSSNDYKNTMESLPFHLYVYSNCEDCCGWGGVLAVFYLNYYRSPTQALFCWKLNLVKDRFKALWPAALTVRWLNIQKG